MGKFSGIFNSSREQRSQEQAIPAQNVEAQPTEAAQEPPATVPRPGRPRTGKSSNKKDFKSSTVYFRKKVLSDAQNIIKEYADAEETLVVAGAEVADLSDLVNALLSEFINSHSIQ